MSGKWGSAPGAFPFVSSIRVYEPLDAFGDADQSRIVEQRGISRAAIERREALAAQRRNVRTPPDPFPHSTAELFRTIVFETQSGSQHFYSPSQVALRAKLAAADMQSALGDRLRNIMFPESAVEEHFIRTETADTDDLLAPLVYSKQSTWGIPLAWFVAFTPMDVIYIIEDETRVNSVLVHTPLPIAIDRVRRAVATIATKAPDLEILDGLTSLSEWFDSFSPNAILELDYGPVADFVFPDDSMDDVMLGIESIAEGDLTAAAAAYRRLTSRWIPIRQRARAS